MKCFEEPGRGSSVKIFGGGAFSGCGQFFAGFDDNVDSGGQEDNLRPDPSIGA